MIQLVLLDTCILLDIFIKDRPRHVAAQKLYSTFEQFHFAPIVPIISFFELAAAINQIKSDTGQAVPYNEVFNSEHNGIRIETIDLDEEFMHKYLNPSLPRLKANDLLFLSIAHKDQIPFITEDIQLFKNALQVGCKVFKIADFIEHAELL